MEYEVLVVGGGIGGLTVASLLSARGMNVCLFERQSQVGGCVANFEFQGYEFEPTSGLYSGWQPGGIHERIFSELPVQSPEVRPLRPAYVVRLPDQVDVEIGAPREEFEENLRAAFPECGDAAVVFYREMEDLARDTSDRFESATVAAHLTNTSQRFQHCIDAQLETFDLCASDRCSLISGALTLTAPQRGMWAIKGGAQALANRLAESIRVSGGSLRLNSPVLRLAYASDGSPSGVDLLSGERVTATRAIISNLTIWDTYGRLVGLNHTPPAISAQLKLMEGRGAYMLFVGMDQSAGARLTNERFILVDANKQDAECEDEVGQLVFNAAPSWDPRAPEGQRAVTVWTPVDVNDWFAFHQDEAEHDEQDQAMIERLWPRLHAMMPELGDCIEVIESATPRTFHENTRRRLGMVGGLCSTTAARRESQAGRTVFPNLFLVGDTVSSGDQISDVCRSALKLADAISL